MVPPQPISMSSACAPRQSTVFTCAPGSRLTRSSMRRLDRAIRVQRCDGALAASGETLRPAEARREPACGPETLNLGEPYEPVLEHHVARQRHAEAIDEIADALSHRPSRAEAGNHRRDF